MTQDPDKLPVELSLLQQLLDFKPGEPFYAPDVTKFTNDLSSTRYFNTVNVESILPPTDSSEASTLAFDNEAVDSNDDVVIDDSLSDVTDSSSDDLVVSNESDVKESVSAESNNSDSVDSEETVTDDSSNVVDTADIAAIEFEADEATLDKLQAIEQKADRLSRLPNDRVLDEKEKEAENLLGKISDSISNVVQKILPDETSILADESFVPPTLAGRKTPEDVAVSKKYLYMFLWGLTNLVMLK